MPTFYEIYGNDPYTTDHEGVEDRRRAVCPFTEEICDGGGNRHQTKIKLANSELREFFHDDLSSVIPGVCSIQYGSEVWVVWPRRLLGFVHKSIGTPVVNHSLKSHERAALIQAGLPQGIDLGVWAEVYLRCKDQDSTINYHFDFLIAPISRDKSFTTLLSQFGVREDEEIDLLIESARTGGYIAGRYSPSAVLPILPELANPIIIEVMTASTSGSNTEAGTDIASAFTDALMGREHACPGINKRQVWGRMATQLFAKSALAQSWGGKAIWLVQDQLLQNISKTTKLNLGEAGVGSDQTISFLSMKYDGKLKGVNAVSLCEYSEIDAGLSFEGNATGTDILLPKATPDKRELLKSVLRRKLSGIVHL